MQPGIYVRDVGLFDKSQLQKHENTNTYYAPIFTREGAFWYLVTFTMEKYLDTISTIPDGLKHVIFGGYLRDVPLVQDYLGTINESHQQIEIVSFEWLDSKVHVPADLAVSGTVVPLHFAPGVEEGYYLLNFKESATFQSMDQDSENVLDDADDGDIMIVEDTNPRLSDVMFSDFDKEILGVAEGSSKGKATATSSRKQADKGKKPMKDVSQPVAKSKTKSKNDIFSRLLAKSAAIPLMAAVVVEETQ